MWAYHCHSVECRFSIIVFLDCLLRGPIAILVTAFLLVLALVFWRCVGGCGAGTGLLGHGGAVRVIGRGGLGQGVVVVVDVVAVAGRHVVVYGVAGDVRGGKGFLLRTD